jgi:integrase
MRNRYQRGCLRRTTRKSGSDRWEFLWRENTPEGKRVRRTAVVGTVEQLPTRESAEVAVNGLRMCANQDRNRQPEQTVSVGDLIDHYSVGDLVDHYMETELSDEAARHSLATRIVYREFLTRWIRPQWADMDIRDVRTVAVERWLRQLRRVNGDYLADATKAKIRNLMSVLFNHAIRYEWLGQGRNPIALVRQSAQPKRTPEVLEPCDIRNLLAQLESCYRVMVLLDATTGLRRSELLALKWRDVDFSNLQISVERSIYLQVVGDCKTKTSCKPVPLDIYVAADLWWWRELSKYRAPEDWVFASPRTKGKHPFRPDALLQKVIRPAAARAGITRRIGWHTFRHTFSTLLVANGENIKVVQELMRHASSRCTLEVYSQANAVAKRQAQQHVLAMIFPEMGDAELPVPRGNSGASA